MGDAGYFRGTSAEQDNRFSDKEKKLMKQMRFAESLSKKVDMTKVKLESIKPWIAQRVSELLGMEDDVLNEFVINQLEDKNPDGKRIQINLTGFLNGKNARIFTGELWDLLVSAQENSTGIPASILEAKKAEIQKRSDESEELKKTKEKLEAELREKEKETRAARPPRRSPTPEKPQRSRRSRSRSPERSRRVRRSPTPERPGRLGSRRSRSPPPERISRFSRRSPTPERRPNRRSRTPERSRRRSPPPERTERSRRHSPSPTDDRRQSSSQQSKSKPSRRERERSESSASDSDKEKSSEQERERESGDESSKKRKKNKKHKKHKKDRKNDKGERDSAGDDSEESDEDKSKKKRHKSEDEDDQERGKVVLDAEAELLEKTLRARALESLKAQRAAQTQGQQ